MTTLFFISQIVAVLSIIISSQVIQKDMNPNADIEDISLMTWLVYRSVPLVLLLILGVAFMCTHRSIRQAIVSMNFQSGLSSKDGGEDQKKPNKIKVKYPLFLVEFDNCR